MAGLDFSSATEVLETLAITIQIRNKEKLFIISVYAPHGRSREFATEFDKLFKHLNLNNINSYYLIAGDLNAKHQSWGNVNNNQRGLFINKWLEENEIEYRAKLYGSDFPTYPRCQCFLDLCVVDCRLLIHTVQDRIKTIPYDSDHNALMFNIRYNTQTKWELETQKEAHRLNYRKTNWVDITNYLSRNHTTTISNDRNLSTDEINNHIIRIESEIQKAISYSIPKIKTKNSIDCYSNPDIEKLQKLKSFLITKINNIFRKFHAHNNIRLQTYKDMLVGTKKLLKQEYKKSINAYWRNKIKNIPTIDLKRMFPIINQIFRRKGKIELANFSIARDRITLIESAGINPVQLRRDQQENYYISNTAEKLEILGQHFANIHKQNDNMGSEGLTNIVRHHTDAIKIKIEEDARDPTRLVDFSSTNRSDNPEDLKELFTNTTMLKNIFKKLNTKKSSGIDGIPNIALKHLPVTIIRDYCILFNNALSLAYFPDRWKKAIVIAIHKP